MKQATLDVPDAQPGQGVFAAIDRGQAQRCTAGIDQRPVAFERRGGDVLLGSRQGVRRDLRRGGSVGTVADSVDRREQHMPRGELHDGTVAKNALARHRHGGGVPLERPARLGPGVDPH